MKRLMVALLLMIFLVGCGSEQPVQTTAPVETVQATEMTEPAGCYVPGSETEQLTSGAVRMYRVEDENCYALEMMGDDVLLFSGTNKTTLTRLAGENLYPIASAELPCMVYPEDASFQISSKGITYYDDAAHALVFLDNDLNEVSRVAVPENIVGTPVLSGNRLQLYYCTADAVRVLDLETGLDRLLKQISYNQQSVEGMLFGDSVLQISVSNEDGFYIAFLSVKTGELVSDFLQNLYITGIQDRYYALRSGYTMQEVLFGTTEADVQMLIPADPFADMRFLEETHGVVTITSDETQTTLDYYDLASGIRTASMELRGNYFPWHMEADQQGSHLYMLGYDGEMDSPVIYRWELEKSLSGDETQYVHPWYTAENPDTEGLAAAARRANELGQRQGVKILVGMEAAQVEPWDYHLEAEYQVPVIDQSLDALERVLSQYPDGFFGSMDEDIRICLVRSLRGSAESGSLETANGIQFWENGTAYVVLAAGDTLENTLYHELFHVIDNHVLSACNAYYDWEMLNPEGFTYDFDYISNQQRDPVLYLEGEERFFIDTYSMSFPKEDRARIMEYAATAEHGDYFASEPMQKKLRTLCEGIRIAFDLRQYPVPLIWEQYLAEPLV